MTLPAGSLADLAAVACFVAAWLGYHLLIETAGHGRRSLNMRMNAERSAWMRNMLARDNRIVDSSLLASLQNGTAFFASTSLLAVGGSLALLRAPDDLMRLAADLDLGGSQTRGTAELKALGLAVIFVYAFFKFAWSYRVFNYAAILMGAVPMPNRASADETQAAADRAAAMITVAGRHFNRGQRAFFFALAYLGWFASPYVLIAATTAAFYVMWRRQFRSEALVALDTGREISAGLERS
ncbi:Uncharacterized membrane protein [Rhizobiales bacterium GAS188]|nr:Uncharacterized membrane protein [Rhizobiales bacterium GAS188]